MPVSFTATIAAAPAQTTAAAVLRDWKLAATQPADDLVQDPATGDAVFLTDTDAIVSDLQSRFLTFRGEWFLDTSLGFPWFDIVLGQKFDEGAIRGAVEDEALACPGIVSVDSVDSSFDSSLRATTIIFTATTDTGAVITATLLAQQGTG